MESVIKEERFDKFEKFIESYDFEKIFYRILLEHDEEWYEKNIINNGCKIINNKLLFIYSYLENRGKKIINNENDSFLRTERWEFKKFIFKKEYLVNNKIKYVIENCYDNKIILSTK